VARCSLNALGWCGERSGEREGQLSHQSHALASHPSRTLQWSRCTNTARPSAVKGRIGARYQEGQRSLSGGGPRLKAEPVRLRGATVDPGEPCSWARLRPSQSHAEQLSAAVLLPTAPSAIMTRLKPMTLAVSTRSRPAQTATGFHHRGMACHQVRPRRTNSRPAFPSPRFHFTPGAGLFRQRKERSLLRFWRAAWVRVTCNARRPGCRQADLCVIVSLSEQLRSGCQPRSFPIPSNAPS
jgi:hypothetical protein